jgi:N-acetyl-beta-hexosaminidase
LGKENPGAIPIQDLKAIVSYARQFNIAICPEMESWGHINSILYHYPECYGAPGVHEGASFGVGPTTILLLEKIYDEVAPCLERDSWVHLGLDEAKWKVLPVWKNRRGLSPTWLGRNPS